MPLYGFTKTKTTLRQGGKPDSLRNYWLSLRIHPVKRVYNGSSNTPPHPVSHHNSLMLNL
ncbi:uncharacterized protein QC763_0036430 [Podospora pseudopauciseta]|uniref:Uncharacterized protein n=1 Tax=Podospora pseudopauciseta TaxID=2093780 RepID=A0ABR0HPL5_9PEZI|nr:hypothetical protein QC763_0036430 [Podospora pseudopauciseta]